MCEPSCCVATVRTPDCGCAAIHVGVAEVQSVPTEQPAVEIEQVEAPVQEAAQPFPAQVAEPKVEVPIPEFAHGENYRWLLGHLQRVHSPQHQWKVRYAPLDEHDEWGGSMVLAPDARLDNFKDGDPVYIEGEILTERPSLYLAGPLYRARTLRHANEVPHITSRIR